MHKSGVDSRDDGGYSTMSSNPLMLLLNNRPIMPTLRLLTNSNTSSASATFLHLCGWKEKPES